MQKSEVTAGPAAATVIALPEYQKYVAAKQAFYKAQDRQRLAKAEVAAATDAFEDAEIALDDAKFALDQAIDQASAT